jgi:2-keto-4-pentenoate hydratase
MAVPPMTSLLEAAEALAGARKEGTELARLPGGLPEDLEAAYALQRAAVDHFGARHCGWKIGATSPEAQVILNTDGPFAAPLFESACWETGMALPCPRHGLLGLEPEFAFRLGGDLPPRDEAYEPAEVRAAIATVHPVFEVIGLRLPDRHFRNVLVVIADFGANVGLVAGAGIADWQKLDLARIEVVASIDGDPVAKGTGAKVLGHPLQALTWLANHLRVTGDGLAAGQWVSTGTCAGVVQIQPGEHAEADFGPIGKVEMTLTG